MKKTILIIIGITLLLSSCVKDRGNTSERNINQLEVYFPQYYYERGIGEELNIEPIIRSSLGVPEHEARYGFEWTAIRRSGGAGMVFDIAFDRNLNLSVNLPANQTYDIRYRVYDSATGVFAQAMFTLLVREMFTTGWVVMCEVDTIIDGVNVRMRLDMLPTRIVDGVTQFSYVRDVLHASNSELPLAARGRPIGMVGFQDQFFSPNRYAFYILTETGSNRLNSQTIDDWVTETGDTVPMPTFAWIPRWNIRNNFASPGTLPAHFVADAMETAGLNTLIAANGNVYQFNPAMQIFFGDPVNKLVGGGKTFRTSPKIANAGGNWIIFDEESKSFRRVSRITSEVIPEGAGINIIHSYQNMTDFELVEALSNRIRPTGADGLFYAIMKNTKTNKFWVMRSEASMSQLSFREVDAQTQTLLEQAVLQDRPLFEAGGYHTMNLYFAVNGKVHSYSTTENRTLEVLDRTGKEITMLKFSSATTTGEFAAIARDILVATFDGTYGLIEQFRVEQNDPFIDRNRSFGINTTPSARFGKVIDVFPRVRAQ